MLDVENTPMRMLMFMGNAAKKYREDKIQAQKAQEKALSQR